MSKKIFIALISLLAGSLIYICFRVPSLRMFEWFCSTMIGNEVVMIRQTSFPLSSILPKWFLFSLPNGLWIFSYITALLYIWDNQISKNNLIWFLSIPSFSILSEFGQSLNYLPGTYDINDIISYSIGMIAPIVLFRSRFMNFGRAI